MNYPLLKQMALRKREYQFTRHYTILSLDRDHNAAINILTLGMQSLGVKPIEATGFSRKERS